MIAVCKKVSYPMTHFDGTPPGLLAVLLAIVVEVEGLLLLGTNLAVVCTSLV